MLFDGRDVTRLAPTERNIAQVFQFPVIYDTMTVYENLAFPLKNRGVPRAAIEARVRAIADLLELGPMLDRRASGLIARQQAEDLDGPRPRPRGRQRHHVRRAADRHRPAPEVAAALQAQGAAPARRRDDDLRHPRPDRGADLRRPGRGHAGRRRRAGRLAGRPLRAPGAHLRRPLHRLAGHEHPALRGRRAATPASPATRSPPSTVPTPGPAAGSSSASAPSSSRSPTPASRPRSSASPTSAAAASSRRSPATAASTPSSTRTAPSRLGPAHLAFDPAADPDLRRRLARGGTPMKTVNQHAWWFVLPVLLLVAFNALVPLMTVVNYSVQETFGNNVFFWHGLRLVRGRADARPASTPPSAASCSSPSSSSRSRCRSASPSRSPCRARAPGSRSAWC